jgi:hypothetical protein
MELSQMSELRTITTLLTTDAAGAFRPIGNENLEIGRLCSFPEE